jgi:hypothetical protein
MAPCTSLAFFWQSLVCVVAEFWGLWKRAPKSLCVAMAMVNSVIVLYASFATDAGARSYVRLQLSDCKGSIAFILSWSDQRIVFTCGSEFSS